MGVRSAYSWRISWASNTEAIHPRLSTAVCRKTRTRTGKLIDGGSLRYLEMAQRLRIMRDALIQRFSQALAMIGPLQKLLLPRIAEETDLREDGGHRGANEHDERRFLDAAILGRCVISSFESLQRSM